MHTEKEGGDAIDKTGCLRGGGADGFAEGVESFMERGKARKRR